MSTSGQRGALIGGVILILIGLLFFLENWFPDFSLWNVFARFWPVLLILIGLRKLYSYFTYLPPPPSDRGDAINRTTGEAP
jgi:putative Mn2+ efflux pump MntP